MPLDRNWTRWFVDQRERRIAIDEWECRGRKPRSEADSWWAESARILGRVAGDAPPGTDSMLVWTRARDPFVGQPRQQRKASIGKTNRWTAAGPSVGYVTPPNQPLRSGSAFSGCFPSVFSWFGL